ncbi:MAG: hypothetical protein V1720_13720 [bacterium]
MNGLIVKWIYGLIVVWFCFTSTFFSQTKNDSLDLFSISNRRIFADYLFSSKDYLRAVDEYRAVLKQQDDDSLKFKIGLGFYEMGEYAQAADYYKSLFFNPVFTEEAEFGYYKCYFFSNDFEYFRSIIDTKYFFPFEHESEINKLKYISQLIEESSLPDSSEFASAFSGNIQRDMLIFYSRKKYPDTKNPITAAILSAIIPGSGKIYTGDIGDGITALLSTGVCGFLAYDNFQANHDFRGWLFTGLTAFFYAGNIYGSAASAHLHNALVKINFHTELNLYLKKNNYFLKE